jgi:hypothetical protein
MRHFLPPHPIAAHTIHRQTLRTVTRFRQLAQAAVAWGLMCWAGTGSAGNLLPSLHYLTLSSPWRPTTSDECSALGQAFNEQLQQISADHNECIKDAPQDEQVSSGSCAKAACQALHTASEQVSKRSSAETALCRERVAAYQAEQRREAAEAQRRQDERAREEREEAQQRAKAQQERAQKDAQRQAKERERREKEERARKERDERDARDAAARREAAAREQADAMRRQRDEAQTRELARLEARERAQQEAQRAERNSREQSIYEKLLKQVADAKTGHKIMSSENPFAEGLQTAAGKMNESLLDAGLKAALPIGPEKMDTHYDRIASVVSKAQERGMAGNPFAADVAGQALTGVQSIHRRTLGQLEQVHQSIDAIGRNTADGADHAATASSSTSSAMRTTPLVTRSAVMPDGNPFLREPSSTLTYYNSETHTNLQVPEGHVLYRDPQTRQLLVVSSTEAASNDSGGDRPELGNKGCSKSGTGIVTPACEAKRRQAANPFR